MRLLRKAVPSIYIGIILVFLYLPIALMIVYSFNKIPKSFVWGGFTLDHYINLFSGSDGVELLEGLMTTLKVAAIASVVSTVFGVITCLGMAYLGKKLQGFLMNITYIPNVMPELVIGISFMLLFSFLGVQKGELTLIIAHIAFCVPFAILSIEPKIKQLDKNLSEAAMDLGATRFQTLRLVIIPEIMPGIISSLLLTFTLSIDDYLISNFNVSSSVQTLPMKIYAMAKFGVNPKMNALTAILFAAVILLLLLSNLSRVKGSKDKTGGVKK